MEFDPNKVLKESATTWLRIRFSPMWIAVGIGTIIFATESHLTNRGVMAELPLIVLAGFFFTRYAYIGFKSEMHLIKP